MNRPSSKDIFFRTKEGEEEEKEEEGKKKGIRNIVLPKKTIFTPRPIIVISFEFYDFRERRRKSEDGELFASFSFSAKVKSRRRLIKAKARVEEQQERATLGFPRRVCENLVGVSSSPPRIFLSYSLPDLFNLLFLAAGRKEGRKESPRQRRTVRRMEKGRKVAAGPRGGGEREFGRAKRTWTLLKARRVL